MAKIGRPKLDIDEKVVESLAKVGATNCEIADHFGCDETTIRDRFTELLRKTRANRKIKLRELQLNLAHTGNLGMLIWLGKQYLGQSDKVEQKQEITVKDESVEELKKLLKSIKNESNS